MRNHKAYMRLAIKLAEKGKGCVSPNPLVGAIIVKRGSIAGQGFHKKCGQEHAEIIAIRNAGKKAIGSTLYVTLEPCSHWGKTPPCTEKIVDTGIKEVIIGMKDPNREVDGYNVLRSRGIKTRIGILEEECKKLNEPFVKWIKCKMPFVAVKAAMSLDGKIATNTGNSKYITGKEARRYVHNLRSCYDAVLVGANTVVKDDPQLTTRMVKGRNPIKIVLDSKLKLPLTSKVFKNEPEKLIVATTKKANKSKIKKFENKGTNVLVMPTSKGMVDLMSLMKALGKLEICSVLVEGGAEINTAFIKEKLADKVLFFISPKIIGKGLSSLGDLGISQVDKSIKLKDIETKKLGKDILVEGYL